MLPLFGPNTVLGAITLYPDTSMSLTSAIDHYPTRIEFTAFGFVELRARLIDVEKLAVGDRYTFVRDAYLQRRKFLVSDGVLSDEELFDVALMISTTRMISKEDPLY